MAPADVRFMVQAANGVGLTNLATNFGAYFIPGGDMERTPTTLTLDPLLAGVAAYGTQVPFAATLRDPAGQPLANKQIFFGVGAKVARQSPAAMAEQAL